MKVTIHHATEEEVRSGFVGRQLREFNYGYVGAYPEVQYIRLNARDTDGQVVGGLRAIVAMYWLRVEVLWVSEGSFGVGPKLPHTRACSRHAVRPDSIGQTLGRKILSHGSPKVRLDLI